MAGGAGNQSSGVPDHRDGCRGADLPCSTADHAAACQQHTAQARSCSGSACRTNTGKRRFSPIAPASPNSAPTPVQPSPAPISPAATAPPSQPLSFVDAHAAVRGLQIRCRGPPAKLPMKHSQPAGRHGAARQRLGPPRSASASVSDRLGHRDRVCDFIVIGVRGTSHDGHCGRRPASCLRSALGCQRDLAGRVVGGIA